MSYKYWTEEETAYIAAASKSKLPNKQLAALLGRSVESVKARKRDIKTGKNGVDKLMLDSILHTNPSYNDWICKSEKYISIYQQHLNAIKIAEQPDENVCYPEDVDVQNDVKCSDVHPNDILMPKDYDYEIKKSKAWGVVGAILLAVSIIVLIMQLINFYK